MCDIKSFRYRTFGSDLRFRVVAIKRYRQNVWFGRREGGLHDLVCQSMEICQPTGTIIVAAVISVVTLYGNPLIVRAIGIQHCATPARYARKHARQPEAAEPFQPRFQDKNDVVEGIYVRGEPDAWEILVTAAVNRDCDAHL